MSQQMDRMMKEAMGNIKNKCKMGIGKTTKKAPGKKMTKRVPAAADYVPAESSMGGSYRSPEEPPTPVGKLMGGTGMIPIGKKAPKRRKR